MPYVEANRVRINFDDRGQGEPALLFMPGWCSSRVVFNDVLVSCSRRRRALALDWRGHGQSSRPTSDFGQKELVEDALALIGHTGLERVVPVGLAHAGWVAIELARRLKERVAGLVFIDWLVLGAPPPFLALLAEMQSAEHWREAVNHIFDRWLSGVTDPALTKYVRDGMGSYGFDMWSRAAREILASYRREKSPLQALQGLSGKVPALHLCAQIDSPGFLEKQQEFAMQHPWFEVLKLNARTHFATFEVPDEISAAIDKFVSSLAGARTAKRA